MPTFRQLRYLVAIADERHFGRAAQRVNVAQPTLSAQFAELERKLGVRLVERSRSGVSVTPLGREIVARAQKVLVDVQEIINLAAAESSGIAGRLRLGVPPTLGPYLLPHVIPEMHERYPKLKLYVHEDTPREIQERVASGDLDIILTPSPVKNRALEVMPLFDEKLEIVCAPDHRFASLDRITPEDLRGEKILTLEHGHYLHDQVRGLSNTFDAEILYDYEGTSLDTLRHMVGMGVGISFFPELYVLSEIRSHRELKVLQLHGATLSRKLCIAWRTNSHARHLGAQLQELIRSAFESRHQIELKA